MVRNAVPGGVAVGGHGAVEDMDELCAGDGRVHLRRRVTGIACVNDLLRDGVVHIAAVPERRAVFQSDLPVLVQLVQCGGQLDRLRHGQCLSWREAILLRTVDQTVFPCQPDAGIEPVAGCNVCKRKALRVRRGADDRGRGRVGIGGAPFTYLKILVSQSIFPINL